jgi:hypothetical protein
LDDALTLLDAATERARANGDEAFAVQLEAEAADVAGHLAQAEGRPYKDAIARARKALANLREVGDRRRFAQSVDSLYGMITLDFPREALVLATEAAEISRSLGDDLAYGRAVYRICDAALDLNDVETFEHWRSELETLRVPAMQRAEADLLLTTYTTLRSGVLEGSTRQFRQVAGRMQTLGEHQPVTATGAIVCSALWQGHVDEARETLSAPLGIPPNVSALFNLIATALAGPEWPADTDAGTSGTLSYPIRALIHYLRGEREAGDQLLVDRYEERIAAAGHAFQRFTPFYPGPLASALGPPSTHPDVDWLCQWIFEPSLPGLWPVNRAISAVVLGERGHALASQLASQAIDIVASTKPDAAVAAWITERARALIRTT